MMRHLEIGLDVAEQLRARSKSSDAQARQSPTLLRAFSDDAMALSLTSLTFSC